MSTPSPASVLRPGLLAGRTVVLAGVGGAGLGAHLESLGARVEPLTEPPSDEDPGRWTAARAPVHGLVVDTAGAFATGGRSGLSTALDLAWACTREVGAELIARSSPGKLVLIAPGPDSGPLASAARAGLENLARTLSVEWARYRLTAVAVLPGAATKFEELAEVVAFLLSAAGEYFSGCCLELGAVAVS